MSQHAKPLHFLPSSSPFSFRLWESFCPLFFSSQKTPHLWDGCHFLIHIRNGNPHPKYARFFVCGSNFEIAKRFLPFDFFSRFVCGAPGKLAAQPYSFRLWKGKKTPRELPESHACRYLFRISSLHFLQIFFPLYSIRPSFSPQNTHDSAYFLSIIASFDTKISSEFLVSIPSVALVSFGITCRKFAWRSKKALPMVAR